MQVFVEFVDPAFPEKPVFVDASEVVAVVGDSSGGSVLSLRYGGYVDVDCGPREAAGRVQRALLRQDPTLARLMDDLGIGDDAKAGSVPLVWPYDDDVVAAVEAAEAVSDD